MARMTIADFFEGVLTDWRKFIRLVIILFATGLAIAVSTRVLVWMATKSGLQPTTIELSGSPKVVLERAGDDRREYLLVVQPQGWFNSGIDVRPGDRITFQAQGSVNINSSTLQDLIQTRRRIERRLTAEKNAGKFGPIPDSLWLPERHYTAADRDSLKLLRGWMGPDGDMGPNGLRDSRYPARAHNKILQNVPYGALLAAVSTTQPVRFDGFSQSFRVGSSRTLKWGGDRGDLWLIVNDVWDDEDDQFPNKFYIDNIGFYLVRVIIDEG
jgi:hypothetical protein